METCYDTRSRCGSAQTRQTSSCRQSENGRQKMENMEKLTEHMVAAAPFVGTALAGCLLQALKARWQGWKNFCVSAFSAGFGAWLVYWLVGSDAMSSGMGMFASGMVGYSGGALVDVAFAIFSKQVETGSEILKGK